MEGLRECMHVPPIILITAFGDEETHAQGRLFGAAAVMDKPFDVTELLFQARKIIESNAQRPGQPKIANE